jgi:hypothetical protein
LLPNFENLLAFQRITHKHRVVGAAMAVQAIYFWANQIDFADLAVGAPVKAT